MSNNHRAYLFLIMTGTILIIWGHLERDAWIESAFKETQYKLQKCEFASSKAR